MPPPPPLLLLLLASWVAAPTAFVIEKDQLVTEETPTNVLNDAVNLHLDQQNITLTTDVQSADFDAVVVITDTPDNLIGENLVPVKEVIQRYLAADKVFGTSPAVTLTDVVASKRLVYASVGSLEGDENDVRTFAEAAARGVRRALLAGSKRPLLVCAPPPGDKRYTSAFFVAVLGVLQELYQPLSVRESDKEAPVEVLGLWHDGLNSPATSTALRVVQAIEAGRLVARDICGADPERMAPPKVEEYLSQVFADTGVSMYSTSNQEDIQREFPLVAAVSRAAQPVTRHRPRIVKLMFSGPGEVNRTLLFAGKGVTYDSGGADIKYGGSMASMSRDKCGAAAVVGIVKALHILQPPNLRVIAAIPLVRNSVGANSYVSDEVITARSGVRIRIGNTDAEGRLILADALCRLKEMAQYAPNPHIISIATLTGHAESTGGNHYSMLLDNEPARAKHIADSLQATGDKVGDPFEISRIRREDFQAHKATSDPEADLVSAVNNPYSRRKRGHQKPTAFLLQASGLDKHGSSSKHSLGFSHVDIAGPAMIFPVNPVPAPVVAMVTHFGLSREDKLLVGVLAEGESGEESEVGAEKDGEGEGEEEEAEAEVGEEEEEEEEGGIGEGEEVAGEEGLEEGEDEEDEVEEEDEEDEVEDEEEEVVYWGEEMEEELEDEAEEEVGQNGG
ncbi:putative aminopeptidase W07G4.4 [Aplysia californica]|uniref:Aminopeptidase W07G4.4 n=1 Tax=Aplysia californica TaxID=6500 RepID=A0ABM1A0Z5_APLCA|nr:putative aminopeptidase W07G4.4 [Aplysia californica]